MRATSTSNRKPPVTRIDAPAPELSAEVVWLGCGYVSRGARKRTLVTGDVLAEHRGIQTLILSDQGVLTLFPDGSAHLQAAHVVNATHKNGVSTIVLPGYDYVRFDCYGIICVVRGDKIAAVRQPLVPPRRNRRPQAWLPGPQKDTLI